MGIKTREPWQGLVCSAYGSSIADLCCMPMDVVKVRMELCRSGVVGEVYRGPVHCISTILRREGTRGLFKGLSPALMRACTYGSARIGLYEPIKQALAGDTPADRLPLSHKALAGVGSGGLAAFIFSPVDLVKVRMQGDRHGTRYPRLLPAFVSIARKEGFFGMYRGVSTTVARAATCGMVELVTYDEFKGFFIRSAYWPFGDSLPTHAAASVAAGFLSTLATAPIDLVKSRVMNQTLDTKGRPSLYSSPGHCLRTTIAAEGLLGLYVSFWPTFMRLAPHTVLSFVGVEWLMKNMSWVA